MLDDYMNNFENIVSSVLFLAFKVILIILVILLILSLVMLGIGCLIKSQKIKSKFLTSTLCLFVSDIVFLLLPVLFVHFKNLI